MNHPRFHPAAQAPLAGMPEIGMPPIEPDKPLEALLEGFLDTIMRMTGALGGAIRLVSGSDPQLYLGASRGLPAELSQKESHVGIACGVCGEAVQEGRLHYSDSAYCAERTPGTFFSTRCRGVVAVPLDFRGQRIGVFNLFFGEPRDIGPEVTQLLGSYAELIGLTLENARLMRDNQRINLLAERQAIANEIHDSLSQNLFYGRLRMSVLSEALRTGDQALTERCLDDIGDALDSGQKAVRELITHFRSQMDPLGLHHALQMLIDSLKARSSITFEFVHPSIHPELTLEQELQVFHVLREALNNVVLHSQATQARLAVTREGPLLQFEVTDNGLGMAAATSPAGHYGLTIMQERARRIGASLGIHSAAGVGTRIVLVLPTA
ncbi:MAG: GAF domain-containing protein [Betaproteobacteria bacterium]|nr:GAF domain-containing protein [Betaproteobacteria bacterium]